MDPSTNYYKTKRTLLLFVGALLLSMVAGLKIGEEKIAFLPLKLEHPDWLTHILVVAVLFYLFQFSLQWAAQLSEIQTNIFHRIDFFAITTITVGSLLFYMGWMGWPYVQKFASAFIIEFFGSHFFLIIAAAVLSFLSSWIIEVSANYVGRMLRNREASGDETIMARLKSNTWILSTARGKGKEISFNDDNTIGEGANENENKWRVRNGLLEIMNSQGRVFSRFSYDDEKDRFVHTNDPDTLSNRAQTMRPK
jgi:hypothetical protein